MHRAAADIEEINLNTRNFLLPKSLRASELLSLVNFLHLLKVSPTSGSPDGYFRAPRSLAAAVFTSCALKLRCFCFQVTFLSWKH